MRTMGTVSLFPLVLLLLFALAATAHAEVITGKVVGVADGDTLTLLDESEQQHKIRLSGIDAPEKAQPFGQKSKDRLAETVFGKIVAADCHKTDRYGRRICSIMSRGHDVGLLQVRAGLAWWYRQYEREQTAKDRVLYEQAEAEAKAESIGLWSEKVPVPPWAWRHPAAATRTAEPAGFAR
jgi:endonuclease YncB( thermonuclease family)